jgi:hypothetical protein
MDEGRNAGIRHRLEDPCAAVHVHRPDGREVVRWLDQPGEMNDGVGTAEVRYEIGVADVGATPVDAVFPLLRHAPRDAHDRVDRRV